jgi:RNA recognition motif-containing protein
VTTADVARLVARACGLRPLDVFLDRKPNGTLAGYGFVEMHTEPEAAHVVARGVPPLAGREIVVARRRPVDHGTAPRGSKPPARLPADLFIGNVPAGASDFDVEVHVAAIAPVVSVGVPRAPDGHGLGVAFIVLHDAADAARVVRALDGVPFQGRVLRVEVAQPERTA